MRLTGFERLTLLPAAALAFVAVTSARTPAETETVDRTIAFVVSGRQTIWRTDALALSVWRVRIATSCPRVTSDDVSARPRNPEPPARTTFIEGDYPAGAVWRRAGIRRRAASAR